MTFILDPSDPTVAAWRSGTSDKPSKQATSKQAVYNARWRAKNPERQREYDANYSATHREKKRAAYRRWYARNREKRIAQVMAWRKAKKENAP